MKTLNTRETSWQEVYARLTEIIQPRPIALASTLDPEGSANLAPFSFYTMISCNPPLLAFCPQISGRTGEKKDTLKNIEKHPEFVIATVNETLAKQVNDSSAPYDYGISEFEKVGLTPIMADKVKAFLVKEAPINMECSLVEIRSYGDTGGAGHLIVGRVELIHIRAELLNAEGQIAPEKLQAVGRMGRQDWCRTSDLFSFPRPDRA